MTSTVHIDVHHLTRVEGHGNIVVNVTDGVVEKCEWQVPEAPRFFESMVRGRHYSEVPRITSRICGICSVGHTLASVKATEEALGIEVSGQTRKLRELLKHAENADSHVLHVYILAAPDLVGAPSVFPLVETMPEVVARALRLKRLCHEWGSLIGGRTTHPTTVVPGGMAEVPRDKDLAALKQKLLAALPDLEATLETVVSLAPGIPAFDRPTEYIALSNDEGYALYDGMIQSVLPDGTKQRYALADYRQVTNEFVVPQSTAKYTKNKLDSYAAGALARFNNNYDMLVPEAKQAADALGLRPICTNPYMNTVAQVVEIVHSVHDSLRLIDELLDTGVRLEPPATPTKHGSGVQSVEVPRGILFHEYEYDAEGICRGGNCIIPTNQNHNNIQHDFEALVPQLLAADKSESEIELALSMLVRAYDPCISCSTHLLDVRFVR
ncbi:MAG TPA: Ni/Fe hydrogenase subunit alpha [Thermoleophilia bacterium]|nr:Ni/Fe hydrogenase subunit alpha [Thermoleophilia bacterium]HQG54429.1 Ni/Fe hydrogenase subunit alpha [Thermoleophilia bacterium]HQJ98424.1 Ni/Fe hydrogenase subunit alpha [Thermoleophilia bacterium]